MKKKIVYILLIFLLMFLFAGFFYFLKESNKAKNLLSKKEGQITEFNTSEDKLIKDLNNIKVELNEKKEQIQLLEESKPFLVGKNCNLGECLFVFDRIHDEDEFDNVAGIGKLTGYYEQKPARGLGEIEGVMCDHLVVTGGSEDIINYYKNFVKYGNAINEVKDGNLILTIGVSEKKPKRGNKFIESTVEEQVEMQVLKTVSDGAGRFAPPCYSTIEILNVY